MKDVNNACSNLEQTLKILNANHMVMGHTVQPQINSVCDSKGILIDTGISRAHNNHPSALEILQLNGET